MSKNILIVTGSDYTDPVYEAFEKVKKMGHTLYLLSDGAFSPREGVFEKHFTYDLRKTKEVLQYMKSQKMHFDAVTIKTSEWLTPLTALLAKHYHCIGNTPKTAFYCRSKFHMRQQLSEAGVSVPKFHLCRNFADLKKGIEIIGLPCVAKPVGGNASYGTFMIRHEEDLEHLEENYDRSIAYLRTKAISEDVFAFNAEEMNLLGIHDHVDMVTDYLVEEFMSGPEISVDSLTQNGKVHILGIADQIRMKPPYFIETAERLPYVCSPERMQEIEKIVKATHAAMGIKNSASHTEIIFTPEGPQIVEIGCRIGGDNIHDAVAEVTGYNLMFESIMIALGEKRSYPKKMPEKCHTMMQYLLPDKAGKVEKISIPAEVEHDPNVIEINRFASLGDEVSPPPKSFDFLGYVTAKGRTPEEAEKNLETAVKKIEFVIR